MLIVYIQFKLHNRPSQLVPPEVHYPPTHARIVKSAVTNTGKMCAQITDYGHVPTVQDRAASVHVRMLTKITK